MNSSGFLEPRDCYRPDERHAPANADRHNCVVDRIEMFAEVLADKNASRDRRVEALKFLVHLVADVHQPLHAIGEARGGNDLHVSEFGSSQCGRYPCNLHFVWDIALIHHSGRSEAQYVGFLEKLISFRNLPRQAGGSPEDWANESFHLKNQIWLNEGGLVDEEYYRNNIRIVDERLALAGLRWAALLNRTLAEVPRRVGTHSGKSGREQVIKHEVNHHAGNGNVQPERISPSGNDAMLVKLLPKCAAQRNDDQRHDGGSEDGVRDQYAEVDYPRPSMSLEVH
jgi:hypothetical protein